MNEDHQISAIKKDILDLYNLKKHESDYQKIHEIERKIAQKLKTYGKLQSEQPSAKQVAL